MGKARAYELTVYHTVDNCGYAIASKSFTNFIEMIKFCTAFDTENEDILFDVWHDGEQFNVNDTVEVLKPQLIKEA